MGNHKIIDYAICPKENGFFMAYNSHRKTYELYYKPKYDDNIIIMNCGKKLASFICKLLGYDLNKIKPTKLYPLEINLCNDIISVYYDSMNKQYSLNVKYGTYDTLKGYKNIKKFLELYGLDFDKIINDYWNSK